MEVVFAARDYESIRLTVADLARPGLQLAGYFDHFEPMRLQVMGNMEASYIEKLSEAERAMIFDRFLSYKFPALLIARNIPIDPQCLKMAQKHNVTVLRTAEATSTIISSSFLPYYATTSFLAATDTFAPATGVPVKPASETSNTSPTASS